MKAGVKLKECFIYVSAVQNVNEVISVTREEARGERLCFDVLFVWGQQAPGRWGQSGVRTDLCPGTEDIYRLEKINRTTENTEDRKGTMSLQGPRL